MKRGLIVAVLLCLLPAAASADRWPAWTVNRAIATADAHWPGSPCYGQHRITWLTGAELDGITADAHYWGYGDTACQVWVAWDRVDPANVYRPGVFLCEVLEHEFGHNAGYGHSSDPNDVMYPSGSAEPPRDCKAAFRPRVFRIRWHW